MIKILEAAASHPSGNIVVPPFRQIAHGTWEPPCIVWVWRISTRPRWGGPECRAWTGLVKASPGLFLSFCCLAGVGFAPFVSESAPLPAPATLANAAEKQRKDTERKANWPELEAGKSCGVVFPHKTEVLPCNPLASVQLFFQGENYAVKGILSPSSVTNISLLSFSFHY